jgi:O-acetyl-ADP-ribose deacetylase (regulator of RNase III)
MYGVELTAVHGDITVQHVDAIVNAANSSLMGGGGVDGAIHAAAGPELLAECRELRRTKFRRGITPGYCVATGAGKLPARWVIHTVGPVWSPLDDHSYTLRQCYQKSLAVADELGARSVAFPLISAGLFRWPLEDAVLHAVTGIRNADTAVEEVRMVLYSGDAYTAARKALRAFA